MDARPLGGVRIGRTRRLTLRTARCALRTLYTVSGWATKRADRERAPKLRLVGTTTGPRRYARCSLCDRIFRPRRQTRRPHPPSLPGGARLPPCDSIFRQPFRTRTRAVTRKTIGGDGGALFAAGRTALGKGRVGGEKGMKRTFGRAVGAAQSLRWRIDYARPPSLLHRRSTFYARVPFPQFVSPVRCSTRPPSQPSRP